MAKNIFSMFQGYVPKPKRNVFDLSFNNNFTTKFGQLTPVLCKEVIPGDSFKIETAAGLRLMPMAFPVQTPMKAYVHYFYVRNRALWKDWQDFITGTKSGLVPPFLDLSTITSEQKKDLFKVGGLADYLGVPNVVYGSYGRRFDFDLPTFTGYTADVTNAGGYAYSFNKLYGSKILVNSVAPFFNQNDINTIKNRVVLNSDSAASYAASVKSALVGNKLDDYLLDDFNVLSAGNVFSLIAAANNAPQITSAKVSPLMYIGEMDVPSNLNAECTFTFKFGNLPTGSFNNHPYDSYFVAYLNDTGTVIGFTNIDVENQDTTSTFPVYKGSFADIISGEYGNVSKLVFFHHGLIPYGVKDENDVINFSVNEFDNKSIYDGSEGYIEYDITGENVIGSDSLENTPYDNQLPLSALPFRAYECIYNSYYRNMQNNPYILNGVEEYNKFIPSNEGGADSNEYKLHQRNWEYDFMTSSVPSPQFGIAPLVGITMTGTATFQDENGTTYYAQAELDDDGTITGWSTHSSNMPAGTLRMLMDSVGTGISINDLRNVNSFQRFLENSLRVGLKYRDQIKGHFGVEVRYDELEMPEFIGGMSLDINVNQVTQTADVQDSSYPLAGFAGQAGAFGSSKHSVTKYCDEHGFIIGILSVVPVPVYSQLLPKFFTKNEQLDYFFPEFGHIGYQPILQKEVSPLQTYYAGDDLNNVFGYQRAWYDYIASTDEVHGQFRTTLRDFVMNRTFDEAPALNEDFLLVDPEQVNDVFLVTSDGEYGPEADKILGQLYFKITKKSPIPMFGIPRLTD